MQSKLFAVGLTGIQTNSLTGKFHNRSFELYCLRILSGPHPEGHLAENLSKLFENCRKLCGLVDHDVVAAFHLNRSPCAIRPAAIKRSMKLADGKPRARM